MRGCLGASAVEAVTGDRVGGDLDWRHSDQVGECSLANQPFGVVPRDGEQGGSNVGAHTFNRDQRRRRGGHELVEMLVQRIDLRSQCW